MREFYRVSGAGNDFLALVEPTDAPSREEIAAWCRRGLSLGADGVFLLDRMEGIPRVRHYNADGRPAELCLNGARCAVRLAEELGWVSASEGGFPILTGAGRLGAFLSNDGRVRIEVPMAEEGPQACRLQVGEVSHRGWTLRVGVPHLVLRVAGGLAELDLGEVSPALRYHPDLGSEGANVNWIEARPWGFEIRTWERGVEGETLACGTGVLAAAAAMVTEGTCALPLDARTRGGFHFSVSGEAHGNKLASWSLSGDARILAQGKIYPGAKAQPV